MHLISGAVRRRLVSGVLLLSLLAVGGACGSSRPEAGTSDDGPLLVWIMEPGSDELRTWFDEARSGFVAAHPGSAVEIRFVPWANAHDQFATALGGRQVPDLAEMGNTWTAEFAAAGALAPVADDAPESVAGMVESATVDGRAYGLPWYAGARALIYRKDVLDSLGLRPPTTWDELVTVGRAVRDRSDVHALGVAGNATHYFLPMVWQNGGTLAERQGERWRSRLAEAPAVDALRFYADLYSKERFSPEGALSWNARDVRTAFETGDLAMMIGGGWDVRAMLASSPQLAEQIGVVLLPAGPAGSRDSFAGGSHLVVFEASPRQELARAFAAYLLEPERLAGFAERIGFLPGTLAGLERAAQAAEAAGGGLLAPFVTQLRDHSRAYPPVEQWGRFEGDGLFSNAVQEIMSGKRPAEEVLRQVAAEMDAAFGA